MPLATPDPGRVKLDTDPRTYGSATLPAEPVFAGLLKDWHLLSYVRITGAAQRDRCPNGTGWPARSSR